MKKIPCLVFVFVAFSYVMTGLQTSQSKIYGQSSKKPSVQGSKKSSSAKKRSSKSASNRTELMEAPPPPPPIDEGEQLSAINDAIKAACKAISGDFIRANSSYAEYPFEAIEPATSNFVNTCSKDGTIGWKATRIHHPNDQRTYSVTVTFKVNDLNLERLRSENGVVQFASDSGNIILNGTANTDHEYSITNERVAEWSIDLREEWTIARDFKKSLNTLSENLAERDRLVSQVAQRTGP